MYRIGDLVNKTAELCYQDLVDEYYRNLNDTLRNFRGGAGFLETWVHDENHTRSIVEILDLAISDGLTQVTLRLTKEVAGSLDVAWLHSEMKSKGTVHMLATPDEVTLTFDSAVEAKNDSSSMSEVYREKLERFSRTIEHEDSGPDRPLDDGRQQYEASDERRRLRLVVDEKGEVLWAVHAGGEGLYRPLLDQFCRLLEGRPLQEGAEHGAIRLENLLRDETKVKKGGIITPQNADPIFGTCIRLIREIYKNYLEKTKSQTERNFWRDPISDKWLQISGGERRQKVESALRTLCAARNLSDVDIRIIEIKNEKRVVLAYQRKTDAQTSFAHALIGLERELRGMFEGSEIELQLESLEDRNKRVERTSR